MSTNFQPADTIARLFGLTPRRVQQLAAEGIIPKAERGQYNLVGAVQGYIKFLQERVQAGDGSEENAKHRARLTKAKADMAEMARDQLAKELIPAEDIEGAWTAAAGVMRARLLSVPSKLAPRMVSVTNANEARELIEAAIHDTLKALADVEIVVVAPLRPSYPGEDLEVAGGGADAPAEADDL